MSLVPVRQGVLRRRRIDRRTRDIVRKVRQFLARITSKTSAHPTAANTPIVASSPSEVQERSGEVVVRVPILGFSALELYVLPDWDSLTIEGRIKQRRTFDGTHWTETIEKRLSHRLVFDFELDPNRVTATLNDATVEIIAHKLQA